MSSAEIIKLPVKNRRRRLPPPRPEWLAVSIRLDGADRELLAAAALELGISLDDMAGRILRNALRLRSPHGGAA